MEFSSVKIDFVTLTALVKAMTAFVAAVAAALTTYKGLETRARAKRETKRKEAHHGTQDEDACP